MTDSTGSTLIDKIGPRHDRHVVSRGGKSSLFRRFFKQRTDNRSFRRFWVLFDSDFVFALASCRIPRHQKCARKVIVRHRAVQRLHGLFQKRQSQVVFSFPVVNPSHCIFEQRAGRLKRERLLRPEQTIVKFFLPGGQKPAILFIAMAFEAPAGERALCWMATSANPPAGLIFRKHHARSGIVMHFTSSASFASAASGFPEARSIRAIHRSHSLDRHPSARSQCSPHTVPVAGDGQLTAKRVLQGGRAWVLRGCIL